MKGTEVVISDMSCWVAGINFMIMLLFCTHVKNSMRALSRYTVFLELVLRRTSTRYFKHEEGTGKTKLLALVFCGIGHELEPLYHGQHTVAYSRNPGLQLRPLSELNVYLHSHE